MKQILEGIRVVDLTTAYSGPFATMQLADFGAEVIKIENSRHGDPSRGWTPLVRDRSVSFPAFNRNKKSVTLNLKDPAGKEALLKLVATADVVTENFRPGTMEKLGLSFEELKKAKPDLIMASLSGYGQTGPMARMSAYSNLAEAMSGVMYLTGFPDGMPTGSGEALGDSITGLYMALGIVLALFHRMRTGEGQYIDIAMTDALVGMLEHHLVYASTSGKNSERFGNRDPACYPYDLFQAKDGYCFLSVSNVQDWRPFAKATELEYLLDDPRFLTNELRVEHADELFVYINDWCKQHTRAEVQAAFEAEHQGFSPVLSPLEVMENEQINARGMIVEMQDPVLGAYKVQGIPLKMSGTPGQVRTPAPEMGASNQEILSSLGYSEEQIAQMRAAQII